MATEAHCIFCFDVLTSKLDDKTHDISATFAPAKYPLFVTWKLPDEHDQVLRGCIGTFQNVNLATHLKEYSILSAFEDSRFDPIEKHELPHLINCVSLLTNFEKADNYLDWKHQKSSA
ncbi:hypothetical protein BB561_001619 [Smittium simulii]|uniref:AMMECR1 domain-containing protein n=1 Tax=Smittium simulii TaxID=133385 RepID=A0A2T9YTV1_9FUNG|nr:hypothetical protein BB561_001619 [Smittium simulii]